MAAEAELLLHVLFLDRDQRRLRRPHIVEVHRNQTFAPPLHLHRPDVAEDLQLAADRRLAHVRRHHAEEQSPGSRPRRRRRRRERDRKRRRRLRGGCNERRRWRELRLRVHHVLVRRRRWVGVVNLRRRRGKIGGGGGEEFLSGWV